MSRVDAMIAAARADERELCAAHVVAKARQVSALIGKRNGVNAGVADHVGDVVALIADELRNGFHERNGDGGETEKD
jgi:hypothetical protein